MVRARALLTSERVLNLQEINLHEVLDRFIAGAVQPALLDPGEEPLALVPGQWSASAWNGRLVLQAWDQRRNLVRKIVGLKEQRRDMLCLIAERFPKAQAELQIADLAAPLGRDLERRTLRHAFRERFYLMLSREFPEWRIEEVKSEANLEESLSASYTRSFLKLGSKGIAVIAAPPDTSGCAGIVAFGLIWLAYLRRREPGLTVSRLLFFVPGGREREVAFRASCIDRGKIACQLIAFDEKDRTGVIDFADAGNIESTLPPCHRPTSPNAGVLDVHIPDVDRVEQSDGSVSLQVRGLEFARASGNKISCGIGRRRRSTLDTALAMAREILRLRDAELRRSPAPVLHAESRRVARIAGPMHTLRRSTRRCGRCRSTDRFRYSAPPNAA